MIRKIDLKLCSNSFKISLSMFSSSHNRLSDLEKINIRLLEILNNNAFGSKQEFSFANVAKFKT